MSRLPFTDPALVADLRRLIDSAHQRAASAVNAELTLLYWQVGHRINEAVLGDERARYGEQVMVTLAGELTISYGRDWSKRNLASMCLSAQLSWSHFVLLIGLKDNQQRVFYIDLKLGRFKAEYKGQMELYLRWLARHEQGQIELLELDGSGIHVAEYLTVLPLREALQARLHQSVETARARIGAASGEDDTA